MLSRCSCEFITGKPVH
jgi:hypothetical protein